MSTKTVEHVAFDLDDTLVADGIKKGCKTLCRRFSKLHGIDDTDALYIELMKFTREELARPEEKDLRRLNNKIGKMSEEELISSTFKGKRNFDLPSLLEFQYPICHKALQQFGLEKDSQLTHDLLKMLIKGRFEFHRPMPGMRQAIQAARDRFKTVSVITNGFSDPQREKMEITGVTELLPDRNHVTISEEICSGKPDAKIFEVAMGKAQIDDPETCAMVGNSLSNDMAGAFNAGMRGILIHKNGANAQIPRKIDQPDAIVCNLTGATRVLTNGILDRRS